MNSTIKQPGAWIPIAMSLTVLAIMLIHLAMFGVVREADEGTVAHIFQIWLVLEVLAVAFFAIRWLPRAPKRALRILALQVVVALVPLAIVFFLKL